MKKIIIEVFSSPGCSKCKRAKEVLRKMVEEMNEENISWREVNILDELNYSIELGVLTTPAIAINKEIIFTGLPSTGKLRKYLENRIKEKN